MATVYVQRNGGGVVVGVYGRPQAGVAEEALADDSADVLAYFAGPDDATRLANARAAAKALLAASRNDLPTALRAVALAAGDGDNVLRDWITQFKAAVAAATSLANLQTRVAALPNLGQLTPANVKAAVANRCDSSDAD